MSLLGFLRKSCVNGFECTRKCWVHWILCEALKLVRECRLSNQLRNVHVCNPATEPLRHYYSPHLPPTTVYMYKGHYPHLYVVLCYQGSTSVVPTTWSHAGVGVRGREQNRYLYLNAVAMRVWNQWLYSCWAVLSAGNACLDEELCWGQHGNTHPLLCSLCGRQTSLWSIPDKPKMKPQGIAVCNVT